MKIFGTIGIATLCLHSVVMNGVVVDAASSVGTGVGSPDSRQIWWDLLDDDEKSSLTSLYDPSWFQNDIDEKTRIAYAYTAQQVYDFLESGADSDETDHYIGFAPLLVRASFHGSGTYTHATGTGGSNGGTIFNHAELADEENGCIGVASNELFSIFHGSSLVPLADTMVIAGVVALDFMNVSVGLLARRFLDWNDVFLLVD
jgi:catalase (peroxidase I)